MVDFIKKGSAFAFAVVTVIFTFVPEKFFERCKLLSNASDEANVVLNRIVVFGIVFSFVIIGRLIYRHYRKKVCINAAGYSIEIEYGDIFEMHDCKKVIPFDECFTTNIGDAPADINPDSICGQYLKSNPINDMQGLIDNVHLKPAKTKSKYQSKVRYDSGRIVPQGDYLLMAFAKLDKEGLGRMNREDYLNCLSLLWEELDKYYGQKDVCIPIIGSGVTRMGDESLTQQELLDMIIGSYRLSSRKLKLPCKLHIVCKRTDTFSLNKIGEYV